MFLLGFLLVLLQLVWTQPHSRNFYFCRFEVLLFRFKSCLKWFGRFVVATFWSDVFGHNWFWGIESNFMEWQCGACGRSFLGHPEKTYNKQKHALDAFQGVGGFKRMSARALSSSIGAGSTAAILLRLLDHIDRRSAVPAIDPAAVCSILQPEPGLHFTSLWIGIVLGLILGVLLYPICEVILAYRFVVFRAIWDRLPQTRTASVGPQRSYRFVNDWCNLKLTHCKTS